MNLPAKLLKNVCFYKKVHKKLPMCYKKIFYKHKTAPVLTDKCGRS